MRGLIGQGSMADFPGTAGRRMLVGMFTTTGEIYQDAIPIVLNVTLLQFALRTTGGPTSVTLRIFDEFGGQIVNEAITVAGDVGELLLFGEDVGAQRRAPLRTMGRHDIYLFGTDLTGGHFTLIYEPAVH